MLKQGGEAFVNLLLILLFFIATSVFIFLKLPFKLPFLFLLAGTVFLISFVNPDFALGILIFSMLLSPEIPILKVPERSVVVRIDDILLIVIFLSWFARTAMNKGLGFLKKTPINKPLLLYTFLCICITSLAIVLGIGKAKFSSAFFYILKYIEYFLLFFLVSNNIRERRQIKTFTVMMLIVCFIVCLYGYWQLRTGSAGRLSAPFEGEKPEPNTLAGYLVVMFSLMGGLLLCSRSVAHRLLIGSLFLFAVPVFLFTLSREGYLAFFVMSLGFIIFTRKARFYLLALFVVLILLLPRLLPLSVIERVKVTFSPDSTVGAQKYELGGKRFAVEESAAARFEVLKWVMPLWLKSPLFGYGVTGIGFVDGQYLLILGELGIIGLMAFFWIILRLFRSFLEIYRSTDDTWIQGISLGLLTSLFALLVQNLGANVFIIVRVMEPFWFLAAMVLAMPHIKGEFSTQDIG